MPRKYLKVPESFTGEYVNWKSMSGRWVNPCAMSHNLYRTISPWAFLFFTKMSFWPTGRVVKLETRGPNTLCFLKDWYSAYKATCHLGQSELALASSKVKELLSRLAIV